MALLNEVLNISHELDIHLSVRSVVAFQDLSAQLDGVSAYPDCLTQREVDVLRLIACGKTNREIAEELFISRNTVIRHVSNIFVKTGSANRAEGAMYAARHRLVS